ncbi:MAG: glycosyltransferase family 2 protein [Patescibacteria group bacterium]|nr:glycosyltransferase family 2 protein [Patescibacteria group bacterium]
MKNPKITVLMPVHNGERYLRKAIYSVLNQSFKDFEFLIINDVSTDNSKKIILSYDDKRIRYIENKKNLGLTKSLNNGLKITKGEYIARQDADDVSAPERLEKQLRFLDTYPDYAVVGSFTKIIDEKSKVICQLERPIYFPEIKRALMIDNCITHGSVMIRKKCLLKIGFYDEEMKRSQDYELWLRLSEKYKLATLSEYLYSWRRHKENIEAKFLSEQKMYVKLAKVKAKKRGVWKFNKLDYQIQRLISIFTPKTI